MARSPMIRAVFTQWSWNSIPSTFGVKAIAKPSPSLWAGTQFETYATLDQRHFSFITHIGIGVE